MASRTRKHSRAHKRTQKRGHRRASRRSVAQRGGYPASAWGWQLNNLGDGWTQFMNSMTPSANSGSNVIVPNKSIAPSPASASGPPAPASASGPAPASSQKGGRHRGRAHAKKGGNWGTVLNQAAVPAAVWAMQYKTKRRRKY